MDRFKKKKNKQINDENSYGEYGNGVMESNMVESLDSDTQKTLLKTFEMFYEQESELMLAALEESRDEIKNSMLDLVDEQERYKEELFRASEGKYDIRRKKENSVPLSEYLRKKRGLPSRNSSDGSTTPNQSQHPTDKMAVEKYLRKKERQKAAEDNRVNRELSEQSIEAETQKILNKLQGVDMTKEKERERQMEKIQAKLKGQPQKKDDQQVATEIIENYQESQLAFERDKKMQQQKFQARLSAARDRRALTPTGRDLDSDSTSFRSRESNSNFLTIPSKNVPLVDI